MLRVTTVFTGVAGSPYFSIMHFGGVGQTGADAAVAAVGDFWTAIDQYMVTSLSWATEAEVENITPAGALQGVLVTTPETGSGGDAGQGLPPATQGLIRWRTGVIVSGRELRGRTFIPGLAETASDGGPQGTFVTDANAAAAALAAESVGELVVWSRTHAAAHPVISGTLWSEFAVLRSRRD